MPHQFSFPVVHEILPPRPAPTPGPEPQLPVARDTASQQESAPASQRSLVAASLVFRP